MVLCLALLMRMMVFEVFELCFVLRAVLAVVVGGEVGVLIVFVAVVAVIVFVLADSWLLPAPRILFFAAVLSSLHMLLLVA